MAEQPTTGDLHVLTGDSKVHVLRPSAVVSAPSDSLAEAIQPIRYTHPELKSSFWMGLAFSSCGRYLASGSSRGGVMTWDTKQVSMGRGVVTEVTATRLGMGTSWEGLVSGRDREVNAVDWGYDMVSCDTSV